MFNHANKHHHDERIKVVYKKKSISLLQMPTLSVPGPILTELVLNSIRIYVENCILRTDLSAVILDTRKNPPVLHSQFKITEHYKEPMKGNF